MKRLKITIALVFVAFVGVVVLQVLKPGESVYHVKTLSEWLLRAGWGTQGADPRKEANVGLPQNHINQGAGGVFDPG